MELIACVDGLTTGPRPDWTPEDDDSDHDAPETSANTDREAQVI